MIGILQTGAPPRSLLARWGGYGEMVGTMLGGSEAVRIYDAAAGELPASPEECRGYVVTGSPAAVYDDLPWIAPLFGFLRTARGRARLAGICFGHQAMAQAFGGTVEKSAKGWGLGLHQYEVTAQDSWVEYGAPPAAAALHQTIAVAALHQTIAAAAFHQDQVVAVPPGAQVLAQSAFTPFAMLRYGSDAISVQFHPEFSPEFSMALLRAKSEAYGALTGPAIESFAHAPDAARDGTGIGAWIGRFLADDPGRAP